MILTDWEIEELINSGELKVSPFDPSLINSNSLDVRLGDRFTRTRATGKIYRSRSVGYNPMLSELGVDPEKTILGTEAFKIINPLDKTTFEESSFEADSIILCPGEFILGCLMEDVTLPDFLTADVRGKSSLGRFGVQNSAEAGFVDANWSGILTIEISNHCHDSAIRLTAGMKIGQLVFHRGERCEKGYDKRGRYMRQSPGSGSKGV